MRWGLWETVSNTLLAAFATEDEALAWVWEVVCVDGADAAAHLLVGPRAGQTSDGVCGPALARRALLRHARERVCV
jgi:hypothetical protein